MKAYTKGRVERLLNWSQDYRDSDKKLMMAYWELEGLQLTSGQKKVFMACTPAETITRARRTLRAKYPGSETVENERFKKFQEHKYQTNWWRR